MSMGEAWISIASSETAIEKAADETPKINNAAGETAIQKEADETATEKEADETPKIKEAPGDEIKQSQDEVAQWLMQCSKHLVHIEKRAMEAEYLGHEVRARGAGCCGNRGPGTKNLSASRTNPVSPPPLFRTRIPI